MRKLNLFLQEEDIEAFRFGEGLILSRPQKLYVLNATATFLWVDLQEGYTLEEANKRQAQRFGLLSAELLPDSEHIYKQWAFEGLIPGSPHRLAETNNLLVKSEFDVRFRAEFLKPASPITRTYRFPENMITLGFQNPALENLIHPAFAHLEEKDITPDRANIELRMENEAVIIHCDGKEPLSTFDLREARTNALNHILDHTSGNSDWCALLHSAALARGKEAIVLAGACQKGKTTLTAYLIQRGWEYLSEDITAIDVQMGAVYGLPSALSLKQGSWDLLSADFPEIETLTVYEKFGSKIRYLPPPKYEIGPRSFGFLFAVDFDPNATHSCQELPPLETLESLVSGDSWISSASDHLMFFLGLLENVPAYRLTYKTLDQALSSIEEIIS